MKIGNLNTVLASERPDLLAQAVNDALRSEAFAQVAAEVQVVEIDASLSDTAAFCEHYDIPLEQAANCVIVEAARGDKKWLAGCIILGSARLDVNGKVRRELDARKTSFAPMDIAVRETGMEYGGITIIGLPTMWPILIEEEATTKDYVILGSGMRGSKIVLPGASLRKIPGAIIKDFTKHLEA